MALPLNSPRASPVRLALQVWRIEGLRGFYRGLWPSMLRAFPANACALFAYEGTMRLLGAEDVRAIGQEHAGDEV